MRKPVRRICSVCNRTLPRAAARCFYCENPHLVQEAARVLTPPVMTGEQASPFAVIPAEDFGRLEYLARIELDGQNRIGKYLREKLDRAVVCPSEQVPSTLVRMGSLVSLGYLSAAGNPVWIKGFLAYPREQTTSWRPISVASPLGSAILGMAEGNEVAYEDNNGASHIARIYWVSRSKQAIVTGGAEPEPALYASRGAPRHRNGEEPREPESGNEEAPDRVMVVP